MSATMEGFADAAAALNAAREAWQADLKQLNAAVREGTATGVDVDAIMARDAEISAGVELLRRKYFPRAHRLIIGMGSAITVSKTARSTRRVWAAAPARPTYDD